MHINRAASMLWGFCRPNDWSARDVQGRESNPLGPSLSKSLSTTTSPWVVTEEALRPSGVPAPLRTADDPALLPYLRSGHD